MSILIKGMEMPGCCGSCSCFHAENPIYCQAVKADRSKRIAAPYGLPRPDWCPLVEVPPHGDLIDREELQHIIGQFSLNWEYGQGVSDCWDALLDAPTIIEAEGNNGKADNC